MKQFNKKAGNIPLFLWVKMRDHYIQVDESFENMQYGYLWYRFRYIVDMYDFCAFAYTE